MPLCSFVYNIAAAVCTLFCLKVLNTGAAEMGKLIEVLKRKKSTFYVVTHIIIIPDTTRKKNHDDE